MKADRIGFALAVSALAVAACGGGAADEQAAPAAAAQEQSAAPAADAAAAAETSSATADNVVVVKMVDDGTTFRFEPAKIEVSRGAVVRFVHEGTQPHNVQFKQDGVPAGVDLGAAWSGPYVISKGDTYELTIDERFKPGTYEFTCTPHMAMNMHGTLVVTE
ncbi:MAG TPA: plastocyanin/azurin family copper-binding protein [Longimicrobiales bacterium]